jgi:acetolactate synthase-1/2/3 large subunit
MALPTAHPALLGHEPGPHLAEADLILVVACDVPWIPSNHRPPPGARVVHIGLDPLFARYPLRGFRADLSILGAPARVLDALDTAAKPEPALLRRRSLRLEESRRAFEARRHAVAAPQGASSAAWVARCIGAIQRPGDVVVSETALPAALLELAEPGSYFAAPSAGGLGWGLGAALGIKLGRPAARVITVVGDGAYMFGNPTPAHFIAEAMDLPTLTIILNNRMWAAVRRATLALYPAGDAAAANDSAFTYLEPSPAYEKVVTASRGYGERVERAVELPAALARALHAVEQERRAAVLNVLVDYTDEEARRDARG